MNIIEKILQGTDGYASVADAMIDQKGFYAHLFVKHPLEVNRQGNEHRTGGFMLELKPLLHLQPGTFIDGAERITVDRTLTHLILHRRKVHSTRSGLHAPEYLSEERQRYH